MSLRSLYNQPRTRPPLIWGEAGGRVKKGIEYVRHSMPEFRSPLEAADIIMIVDRNGQVEFYTVDPRTKPMYTGRLRINLCKKWTTPLPLLVGNQNVGRQPVDLSTSLNVANGEIAWWKIYAMSSNFQFDIEQPAQTPITTNGIVSTRLSYGNTGARVKAGQWGAVPEVVTFEDKVPITINVTPTNPNEATYNAYIGAEGFRYRLIKTEVPDPANEPRAVTTFTLSAMV
jgi:hypothetical protein